MGDKTLTARHLTRSFGTVTVSVPASIADDIEKMNRITKEVLGRLGCDGCHSGRDIRYVLERDFKVNPNMQLEEFNASFGP